MPNGELLGERMLPEAVNQRRRSLRNTLQDFREPIRTRREQLVPGPDVVGLTEERVTNLRQRVMTREGVLSRIRDVAPGGDSGDTREKKGSQPQSKSTDNV